ncbi:ABC transporter ATP-binding protein [Candidatus Bathyarchaeota archaeon]|nr:ABC transporter ATP-binding protein [Candidatus Bathyarchaeota archaeon]MBT6605900.1 ABC transporter ATP-binding protein [Candidatus Bathyarchaeota archaeon]
MSSRPKQSNIKTFTRLIGYISKYWELKAILILILFTTASTAISPAIVGNIIDMIRAVAEGNTIEASEGVGEIAYQMLIPFADWLSLVREMDPGKATLFVFSFALIVLSILEGVFSYMQRYLLTIISQRAGFDMRDDMYNSLLEQSFSFYDQQRTGQLMARATGDINMLGRFFNMAFRMAISNILVLITVIYSMTSLSPELTLIAMVTIPFLLFTTSSFSKRVRPMWKEVREQNGVLTSVLQENLSGLRVVRGFSREEYEEEKFGAEVKKFFDINVTMARVRAFFMPMASLISSVGIVIIIWYGGKQVITGALTLGTVLAFYFYMNRLMGPVRMLGFMTSMFVRAQAAAERVFEIIDAEIDVHDKDDAQEFMTVEGHLVFEDVWFSYDGQNMVLTEIELDVKPGQTIAILGATGSGKSSIINLIPRFYDVSKGSIKLDGLDIRDITIKNLRSHIGIVRQDPYIFSTTLRENIAYGVESTSTKGIEEAAKQAKIHEFIASLPEGYDTKVGERGVTLSGGQKQRVAIARALLKNPKILVLDDSTSSVDTQTEYEIQHALDQLLENRTTFVITQRLSSIKKADYIIVLEDGAIAEEGSHEHLMALDGIYRKLYDTQITGARGGDL